MNSIDNTILRGINPRTKNMLIILGIIGAIIIGALLVYGILVTPSRQPYRDAQAQLDNVMRANAGLTAAGSSLNAGKATTEEFEKNIATAQAALKSLRTENEALSKETVLKDGEGKTKYDAYNAKLQEYMTYNENILNSMLRVRPVLMECNADMSDITASAESIAALRDCAHHLGEVKEVPDADYRQLATDFQADYDELATVLEKIAALPDPKGADQAQNSVYISQRDEILARLTNTGKDFAKSLQQSRNQILTTDTEKKLSDYLKVKSRIF